MECDQPKEKRINSGMQDAHYYEELQTWLSKNEVAKLPESDEILRYSDKEHREVLGASPWTKDPHYFSLCKVSAVALLKMLIHAHSGGNIEVMGLMLGKIDETTMIIHDVFALPVEGTETRVNAHTQAYEYMSKFVNDKQHVQRLENAIGWYHSHPGYGCWLSGIDVGTQSLHQQFEEPYVAIVVDPVRTKSTGKVNIGAFRTFPKGFVPSGEEAEYQSIPMEKIEDFGVHANQYYQLEVEIFTTQTDENMLKSLWNKYWPSTLSTSSLHDNRKYLTNSINDVGAKMADIAEKVSKQGYGSGTGVNPAAGMPKFNKLVVDAEKIFQEVQTGLHMQNLKRDIFSSLLH